MSLVSSWVESREGRWYRNPIVRADDWFICWDDDEPIELVVKRQVITVEEVLAELEDRNWRLLPLGKTEPSGKRMFLKKTLLRRREEDPDGFKASMRNHEWHMADRVFLKQLTPPTDAIMRGNLVHLRPEGQGVRYYAGRV